MVSSDKAKVNVEFLLKMYRESELAKVSFDYFAIRQKNSTATKTDRMLNILYDPLQGRIDRRELIQFFRGLEAAGCGEYVEGRRGHPSRFVWSVQMNTVGLAAAGQVAKVVQITEGDEEDAENVSDASHPFRLRPDRTITLTLPDDLTVQEAQRLSDFIRTLPLSP